MGVRRLWKPITGYKKVRGENDVEVIVTLRIPMFALVYASLAFDKCKLRASRAKVVSMEVVQPREYARDGCDCRGCARARNTIPGPYMGKATSSHTSEFVYEIGKTVRPEKPFSMEDEQCASGIHFYMDHALAVDHWL